MTPDSAIVGSVVHAIISQAGLAVLVLLLMCAFLGWMLISFRKQDREDRIADRQATVEAIDRNTAAMEQIAAMLTELRIVVAQQGGQHGPHR